MTKRKSVKYFIIPLIAVLIVSSSLYTGAVVPYDSYTYSTRTGEAKAEYCPTPYVPECIIDSSVIGAEMLKPTDMCFDKAGNLYIVDSQKNAVIILDNDYKLKKVITAFAKGPEDFDSFGQPEGIFVTDDNMIYICDTQKRRVVVLDGEYNFVREYSDIESDVLGEDFMFMPIKIAVDKSKNFYVVSRNEYSGIMQFDSDGKFISFIGSNKVIYNLIDKMWKKVMTKEQRKKLSSFIPIEYTNISMDSEGFIYAVSKSSTLSTPIKRLNISGGDVLVREGYVSVVGDISNEADETASLFCDIVSDENGVYYALDQSKGRIFVYNSEGYLYYVFGGLGTQTGTFTVPSAIEVKNDKILVLDAANPRITVFKRSNFANLVVSGDQAYRKGKYDECSSIWSEVIKENANYELAYVQIGKVLLRENKYEKAMEYFKLGNYRGNEVTGTGGYNKAFTEYRKEQVHKYLFKTLLIVALAVVCFYLFRLLRKRSKDK